MSLLLDKLATDDGRPALSAHVLRRTFGTSLARSRVGGVTVAQLMEHERSETIRCSPCPPGLAWRLRSSVFPPARDDVAPGL
ncbi:site-specific integrase [Thermobifida halotolerans]|uniref:site-specific integrase n=1 Tax=Thermobifida halotolerans TaxID=483545 RepID=UPI00083964CB|nr:site-specific integrase [Thermobifida halotolerans]